MRKLALRVGMVSLCLTGCTVSRLELPSDPVLMTIIQRHSKPIPGSGGRIRVHIGDVTGGQVLLSIDGVNEKPIVDTVSVQPSDTVPFEIGENQYQLRVIELRNFLVGNDFGVFEISTARPATDVEP